MEEKKVEKKKGRRNLIIGIVAVLLICCIGAFIANAMRMRTPEGQATATAEALASEARDVERTATADAKATEKARPTDTPEPTSTPGPTDTPGPTSTPEPTSTPAPTDTPEPTPTPEIEGLLKEGTHLVGTDIEPGIFVGLAGHDSVFDSCYWARLSNLTGSDDVLSNDNAMGLYYVEVLPDDRALKTACDLVPIDQVPAREEFLTTLLPGIYLVGRDIEAGTFRGEGGEDILESCYWARLTNVNGDDAIIANDNATGQYFIEVLPTDFALKVACEVEKVE